MLHFCTYFNVNYLDRGIALYNSIKKHCQDFTLHILCMDDETEKVLTAFNFGNVHLISLRELEKNVPDLFEVKGTRTLIEYYFTCTPVLPWFLMNQYDIEMITYLDSDLFFFSSPDPLYEELGENSVLITSHNFPPRLEDCNIYGKFNVGLLIFRNDENGRTCLEWWMNRCLEWCYDRVEADRFADQKYLDQFSQRFNNVTVSHQKGVGLAPWNIENFQILKKQDQDTICVDSDPLIFYHFQGFKIINNFSYQLGLRAYNTRITNKTKEIVYRPYIETISKTTKAIQSTQTEKIRTGGSIRFPHIQRTAVTEGSQLRSTICQLYETLVLLKKSDIMFDV